MNKSIHLGLLMLQLSKIIMYGIWCDYVKPIYGKQQNYVTWIQTAL